MAASYPRTFSSADILGGSVGPSPTLVYSLLPAVSTILPIGLLRKKTAMAKSQSYRRNFIFLPCRNIVLYNRIFEMLPQANVKLLTASVVKIKIAKDLESESTKKTKKKPPGA
jgi:hypothetical protein